MTYWKSYLAMLFLAFALIVGLPTDSNAQGGLQQQPLQTPRDPSLEKEAKHNLDVAKFYLKKKAYKAVTDRLLEITYVYPQFSRIDEVYLILGDSFIKLDKKDEAAKFYKRLLDEYPDSQYSKEAQKQLESLPAVDLNKEDKKASLSKSTGNPSSE
jgi:hypothetical protein